MKAAQPLFLLPFVFLAACGGGGGGAEVAEPACALDPGSFASGSLSLNNVANVLLNPNGTTPLSARLQFCAPESGTVKLTVLGKPLSAGNNNCSVTDGVEISHEFTESASDFDLPVLGLYPDYNNTVVVEFMADGGATTRDELMIMTAPLPIDAGPPKLPLEIEIESNNLPLDDAGVYLFSSQKAAFDQCGEVRWLYYGGGGLAGLFYELLPSGNWLGDVNEDRISYHFRGFAEYTMLGEMVREYSVPNYGHHEIQKLPWGNYLTSSNYGLLAVGQDGVTQEDTVLEISADTGLVVRTWDFNDILDNQRAPIDKTNTNPEDWLHLNSVVYDATDNTLVITAQRQSLIAKINYDYVDADDLLWIIASPVGWSPAFESKLLTPVDIYGDPVDTNANYFWPYGPHAALVYSDRPGVVAVFDNGLERGVYGDRMPTPDLNDADQEFSRGVEYRVNLVTMTVQIVWQFDWDQRVYNQITGDIDYLANGNYLLGFVGRGPYSDNPRVIEVDQAGNILFNALANRGENQYRVEKIDLYRGQ